MLYAIYTHYVIIHTVVCISTTFTEWLCLYDVGALLCSNVWLAFSCSSSVSIFRQVVAHNASY